MALYKYIAAHPGKAPEEIVIEGDNEKESLAKLRRRGMIPVRFLGVDDAGSKRLWRGKKPDVFEFTRQLTPLLTANIQLEQALGIISEGAVDSTQKDFVNSLRQGLHEGKKFSEMVRSYGGLFPDYYANLIESGEETGCLPEVTSELYKFMRESRELKNFIVSSSIYPIVIFAVVLVVSVVLFTVFVPHFSQIFADMGRELPDSMRILNSIGGVFKWTWWSLPLICIGGWFFFKHQLGAAEWKRRVGAFLIRIPVAGRIMIDLEICRYLRTLAILIGNHVEIIKTVKIAGRVVSNPVIASGFDGVDRRLKSGEKLSATLKDNQFVPRSTASMLKVGEESGQVGEMLDNIAGNLEADTRQKIKRALSLFEPLVIILLAVIVLGVVVAIFIAMMEINSVSGGQKI
ncbi:MAG: type II secretion system F family protein [Lentisphaeria bacterium]|nr:type II secretion system F family protein [Lentisphaeria bacterium]MBR2720297.1 type II secretion system F family protein [Lentisphaeria bacterium]